MLGVPAGGVATRDNGMAAVGLSIEIVLMLPHGVVTWVDGVDLIECAGDE